MVQGDGNWDDRNCTTQLALVCTRPRGSAQLNRWIGLSDRGNPNTFEWSDGSYVYWTNWGPGYPSTHGGLDDVCVYMDSITGGWVHTACHEPMPSVCKTNQEITDIPPDHEGCDADQIAQYYQLSTNHSPPGSRSRGKLSGLRRSPRGLAGCL